MPSLSKKQIGLGACVAFAVGAMVGAGVFVLSGVAVQDAGPSALISFLLAGAAVLCSAFSFMVIASLAQAGELGYAPIGRVLGHRFWGFLTSWAFYLSAIICTAFVLNAFGQYMHDFFIGAIPTLGWAVIATLALTFLNLGNTSGVGRIEGLLVGIKMSILVLLVFYGVMQLTPDAFAPFAPHGTSGMLTTTGLLFIAYLGFSVVTNIAGDVRDARKTVPRAILLSIVTVILLYVGVVLALLAYPLPHYDEASVGDIAVHLMGPIGGVLVPLAALVSTLSAANSNILGSSEIMVRLAARKDVPTFVGRLHNGHPYVSVFFSAALCLALLATRQTDTVIALANVSAIGAIALINIATIRLMLQKNGAHMRLIGGPLLPFIGLLSCIGELFLLGIGPVLIGFAMIAFGGIVYLTRKALHDPDEHRKLTTELERYGGPLVRLLQKFEERA